MPPMTINVANSTVRRFYEELWNDWRFDLVDDLVTSDLEFRGSLGTEVRGRPAFVGYAEQVRQAFPDFHNDIREIVTEGERVAAKLIYSGTHEGRIFGVPQTQRRVSYDGAAFFRLDEGGKIRRAWVLGDVPALLRQLGIAGTPIS